MVEMMVLLSLLFPVGFVFWVAVIVVDEFRAVALVVAVTWVVIAKTRSVCGVVVVLVLSRTLKLVVAPVLMIMPLGVGGWRCL